MAPNIRREEIRKMGQGHDPVKSSIIILVYPGNEGDACTVFIHARNMTACIVDRLLFRVEGMKWVMPTWWTRLCAKQRKRSG